MLTTFCSWVSPTEQDGERKFRSGSSLQRLGLCAPSPEFGRSDPCPSGSGQKHKRCCGGATGKRQYWTEFQRRGHHRRDESRLGIRRLGRTRHGARERVSPLTKKRHFIGYHLATISGKIRMVECAIVDGKTAQPNWNSLKSLRTALCLSGARRIPPLRQNSRMSL